MHMGEMHQLNQNTAMRSKVLLQWSANAHMMKTLQLKVIYGKVSYRILSWVGGNRMVVGWGQRVMRACLLGGAGACPPRKILILDPFLTQSGTRLLFNTCHKTIITILNFKISGRGGGISGPSPSVWNPVQLVRDIPYSGKLSREKTFANFMVLWLYTNVFSAKFGTLHPRVFSMNIISFTNLRKFFSLESLPLYGIV